MTHDWRTNYWKTARSTP